MWGLLDFYNNPYMPPEDIISPAVNTSFTNSQEKIYSEKHFKQKIHCI